MLAGKDTEKREEVKIKNKNKFIVLFNIILINLYSKINNKKIKIPELNVSYKPQTIAPKFEGSVQDLLNKRLNMEWQHPQF